MYLAELSIKNFRRLNDATLRFVPGLNVLVGPNNIGKTAVVDALRALLAGADDPYPRFDKDDIHIPKSGAAATEIRFEYIFRDLSLTDEADFLNALRKGSDGAIEAVLGISYGEIDRVGRLRPHKWCGEHEDVSSAESYLVICARCGQRIAIRKAARQVRVASTVEGSSACAASAFGD
jgi:putative ATP-dependent endonuclease of OLD family